MAKNCSMKWLLRIKRSICLIWALRPTGSKLMPRAKWVTRTHGLDVEVIGNKPDKPCILVANHLGYLDPVIIGGLINCRPIAKSELSKWVLFGRCLKLLGIMFYVRGDAWSGFRVIRESIRHINSGDNILVFPEGTTTNGKRVLPFKRGIFGVSKITNTPVVPIRVEFMDKSAAWWAEDSFVSHYYQQSAKPSTKIKIKFLEPSFISASEDAASFAERVRQQIESG